MVRPAAARAQPASSRPGCPSSASVPGTWRVPPVAGRARRSDPRCAQHPPECKRRDHEDPAERGDHDPRIGSARRRTRSEGGVVPADGTPTSGGRWGGGARGRRVRAGGRATRRRGPSAGCPAEVAVGHRSSATSRRGPKPRVRGRDAVRPVVPTSRALAACHPNAMPRSAVRPATGGARGDGDPSTRCPASPAR